MCPARGRCFKHLPNCKRPAVGRRGQCRDGIENGPRRNVLGGRRFEEDDVALRVACFLVSSKGESATEHSARTKCDISISHPRSDSNLVIRRKSSDLVAREKIPHNGGAPRIVTHDQTTGPALADGVCRNPRDVFAMAGESSFHGQSVMVEAQDDVALGVEEERGRRSAWLESKFVASWSDAGCWGFVLDI